MRIFLTSVIILLVALGAIGAQGFDANQNFTQANDLFNQKKYKEAAEQYEAILENGFTSADIHYNLGNTYFELGKLGPAVLHLEKCLKREPHNDQARNNLTIVNKQLETDISEIPEFFLLRWWQSLASSFGAMTWFVLGFLSLLGIVWFVRQYLTASDMSTKNSLTIVIIALAILSLILHCLGYSKYAMEQAQDYAVVMKSRVAMKYAPDTKSEDVFMITDGVKVRILDQIESWVKIELSDRETGWISKDDVTII